MRTRALGALVLLVGATAAVIGVTDLRSGTWPAPAAGVVRVHVSELRAGGVLPIEIDGPVGRVTNPRVFVVRDGPHISAFLGVSTHLGCVLRSPGDPGYRKGSFESARTPRIEDPCGGALWTLDGDCLAGPCPRGLDRYPVVARGSTAFIDVRRPSRGPAPAPPR